MLEPNTIIELTLPGAEAPIQAAVLSCSSTMLSVRLQELGTENVHRVSLKKLPYTVVRLPEEQPAGAAAAAAKAGPPADQEQQQQEEEEGSSGSDEEEEEQPEDGSSDEGEQQPGADGSSDEEEDEEEEAMLDAFPPGAAAAVEAFASAVESDPAAFLQPTAELAELAKGAAKALYDYQAAFEADTSSSKGGKSAAAASGALPELYIQGFDAEQIWLQLELAAGPAFKRARRLLKKAGQEPELLTPEMEEAIDELLEGQEAGSGEEEGEEALSGSEEEGDSEDEVGADLADLDYDALLAAGAAQQRRRQQRAAAASDSEDEAGEGTAAAQLAGSKRKRASGRAAAERAAVEDAHFKLDEMEAFVQQAELEAAGLEDGEEDEEGGDDEEADLEAALEQEMAVSARDKKAAKKAKKKQLRGAFGDAEGADDEEADNAGASAMFEDFFGPRSGGQQGPAVVAAGGRRRQQPADEFDGEEADEEDDEEGFEDDMLSDDMLSGEEEGGEGGERQVRGGEPSLSDEDEEGEEEEEEEEEDEMDGWGGAGGGRQRDVLAESDEDEDEEEEELAPSTHARRQERMQEKIRRMEEAVMGEKDWFMQGEVDAARRPTNSALEVDLDFDTTVKPPPQPTEEMTRTLDELIKARIVDGRFDDVVRVAPPPPDIKRTEVELDDRKPQQGLGELYEAEYMQAVTGAADDKDEEVRQAARAQYSALCAKLDALSHLHFTPRPVIEEVAVKVDVPAILMEEAAPAFVSGASMQAPEEVFGSEARGAPQAEGELEREDRKRRRAQRKRAGKNRRSAKDEERAARAVSQGGTAKLAGRKSAAEEEAARKLDKTLKKGGSKHSEFAKSTKVFSLIQQHVSGATAEAAAKAAEGSGPKASHLKL